MKNDTTATVTVTSKTKESSLRGGYVRESSTPLRREYWLYHTETGMYLSTPFPHRGWIPLTADPSNQIMSGYLEALRRAVSPEGRVVVSAGDGYVTEAKSTSREVPLLALLFMVGQCADWRGMAMKAAKNAFNKKAKELDSTAFAAVIETRAAFTAVFEEAGAFSDAAYYAAREFKKSL